MNIYLFQRGLRLEDNLALYECLRKSQKVLGVFCLDPRQIKGKYASPFALGFMLESLRDLDSSLRKNNSQLVILEGQPHIEIKKLLRETKAEYVYATRDYTPFAMERSEQMRKTFGEKFIEVEDYLLFPQGTLLNKSGKPYAIYTPFMNMVSKKKVSKPKYYPTLLKKFTKYKSPGNLSSLEKLSMSNEEIKGGRTEGLKKIKRAEDIKDYHKYRDFMQYRTTQLSAYIKFGCVSIREAYAAFVKLGGKSGLGLKRQLIWREFYYHYYARYPEKLEWHKSSRILPIRDFEKMPAVIKKYANILHTTGYINNRARLLLGYYLLHDKGKYWKTCDHFFAKRLIDYDPIVNAGNWLWIKKQPTFRRLKYAIQEKKYDRKP